MLAGVDVDELKHALGGIVLESAYMEGVLRAAFSALVGSKYAAVVDGRLTASTLIDDCKRLTRYRMDIPAHAKDVVLAALEECHEANRQRNRVIHDAWAIRPGDVAVTLQGRQISHEVTVTAGSPPGHRQVPAVRPAPSAYDCRPVGGRRSTGLRLPASNSPAWLGARAWVA